MAREYNTGDKRFEMFASTPGLQAMRLVISKALTHSSNNRSPRRRKKALMILDVKTAFLYADVQRSIYINLPREDSMYTADNQYVGRLVKSLYGTRDAPQCWQEHLRATLLMIGFRESTVRPGYFRHPDQDLDMCVHVDDLLVAGFREHLQWFLEQLTKVYEVEHEILGNDEDQKKEGAYLGRQLTWIVDEGVKVSPDPKHTAKLLADLGLDQCNGASTPFIGDSSIVSDELVDIRQELETPERPPMPDVEARRHRASVARVVYLAQDRLDLGCVAVGLAKTMAVPRDGDHLKLVRAARYIKR